MLEREEMEVIGTVDKQKTPFNFSEPDLESRILCVPNVLGIGVV